MELEIAREKERKGEKKVSETMRNQERERQVDLYIERDRNRE